jgi:hypothetical protein
VVAVLAHAAREDPQHGAGKAGVGDHQVGAAGHDEQRLAGRVGRAHGGDDRVVLGGLDESPGGSAEAQRRQVRQGREHRAHDTKVQIVLVEVSESSVRMTPRGINRSSFPLRQGPHRTRTYQ